MHQLSAHRSQGGVWANFENFSHKLILDFGFVILDFRMPVR